jgi:lysophospholipase L1-like esterase
MGAVRFGPAVAAAAVLAGSLTACSSTELEPPIYLALGDSWAAGSFDAEEGGYVNRLYGDLPPGSGAPTDQMASPATRDDLELRNLSQGGATTTSLLTDQLPDALALLEERNGDERSEDDVTVITVTIGGNDIFLPILSSCATGVTPGCEQAIASAFEPYADNLAEILSRLRAAAGDGTEIVVTAYDNPIPNCFLSGLGELGALVLEGGPQLPDGLNDITRSVAAEYDAAVAETFGALADSDWVGGFDCLHPNGTGHEKVKDAFLDALAP